MNYIYPKFTKATHEVKYFKDRKGISREYPVNSSFTNKVDLAIQDGTKVAVIEEGVGYNCLWAFVKEIGQSNTQVSYYILTENLINIGGKETYKPINTKENRPDPQAQEINPYLKETFIPYIDRKNGLYSVRIQTDYEKVLDSLLFENLLHDVFYEGVSLLLESRGVRSDNAYIESLIKQYYTFAYINDDLAQTVNRPCEPLTFTVSVPLRFFNEAQPSTQAPESATADIILKLENYSLEDKLNKLLKVLTYRAGDILNLLYPNKFIENFIIDSETESIRTFGVAAAELFAISGFPINPKSETKIYELGLSKDYDLVFIRVTKNGKQYYLSQQLLAQFRLKSEFYSKRIFYYLNNLDGMVKEINQLDIKEFINKYVHYPDTTIKEDLIKVNGKTLDAQTSAQYRLDFENAAESCLNLNDLTSLASGAARLASFSDPIFHMWVKGSKSGVKEEDPAKKLAQVKKDSIGDQSTSGGEKNATGPVLTTVNAGTQTAPAALLDGVVEGAGGMLANTNLNTLIYGLYRINFSNLLFKKLFCYLKGANPNSEEIAEILSKIPLDVINYYNYLNSHGELTGYKYVEALELGVVPDIKLYCAKNSGLIYFIKALTKIVKTLNAVAGPTVNFVNAVKKSAGVDTTVKTENPWKVFGRTFIQEAEKQLIKEAFDLIAEALQDACEDDALNENSGNNFKDPFSTTIPTGRANGQKENNNPDTIKNNRKEVLDKVFFSELQFGFDKEYTVNLIDKLLSDINCILTPQESVQLLREGPTDLTVTLVKNIIRAKYSAPPNDLSFLLNDIKLKQFFKEIGATVDQEYLEEINTIVTNTLSPSQLCSPQQLQAREDLIKNKLPKDLGVLEKQQQIRNRNAKKIFDRIQNGAKEVTINSLCDDLENADLLAAKQTHLESLKNTANSTFAGVLTDFDEEAFNLPAIFRESKKLYRFDSSGRLFDNVTYYLYNSNLGKNINYVYTVPKYGPIYNEELSEEQTEGYRIKYSYLVQETDFSQLARLVLPSDQSEKTLKVICNNSTNAISTEFQNFVSGGNIVFEFAQDYLFDGEGGTEGSDLQEFKTQTDVRNSKLGTFLNNKKYFYAISLNADAGADTVEFKLIYNDIYNNQFRVLDKYIFSGGPGAKTTDFGPNENLLQIGSENFYNFIEYMVERPNNLPEFYSSTENYDPLDITKTDGYNDKVIVLQSSDDVYLMNPYLFNFTNVTDDLVSTTAIQKIIESIYQQKFKKKIDEIDKFESTRQQIEKFQKTGIFQSETLFSKEKLGFVTKKINVGHGKYDPATKKTEYELANFTSVSLQTDLVGSLSTKNGLPSDEIQKGISYVYQFLDSYPAQNSQKSIPTGENITLEQSNSSPTVIITLKDLQEKYVDPIVDYLDVYVTQNGVEQIYNKIIELQNYKVKETDKSAIVEFDRLYTEDESGDLFIDDLNSVGTSTFDQRHKNLLKQTINIYREAFTKQEISIDEIIKLKDTAVDLLDSPVNNSDIVPLWDIITRLSKQTYLGQPALAKFLEEYATDEGGDQFVLDLINAKDNFEDDKYKQKYDQILQIIGQVGLDQYSDSVPAKNIYFKTQWQLQDFIFKLKEGESDWFKETPDEKKITDSTYDMELRDVRSSIQSVALGNLTNLKFPRDQRYRKCNIFPHYLNLDYFLLKGLNNQEAKLCEIGGFEPYDLIKMILVELTFRAHITDLMVKAIPYLATFKESELKILYTKPFFVQTLKQFMKRELKVFSPDPKDIEIVDTIYSKNLFKIAKDVFQTYSDSSTLKTHYVDNESEDKEVDYFIKKEIDRFINYCLEYLVFSPNTDVSFDEFIYEKLRDYPVAMNYARFEYDTALAYYIAANTVDNDKRIMFYSTKSALAQIFFSTVSDLTDVGEDLSAIESSGKKQEDVIDFLKQLSYASSPASMIILRPEYSKYIKRFLNFSAELARNTLGTVAQTSSKNIALTKQIANLTSAVSTLSWSLLDEETRTNNILNDPTLTSKRIADGRSPFPELGLSLGITAASKGSVTPDGTGWAYLGLDTYFEVQWYIQAVTEIQNMKKMGRSQDPCEVPQENVDNVIENTVCTDDLRNELNDQLYRLELESPPKRKNTNNP